MKHFETLPLVLKCFLFAVALVVGPN
jgi:hypothetical protein